MRQRWLQSPSGGRVWQASKVKCLCGGYPFPHREGSGACDSSPYRDFHLALRQGLSQPEAQQLLSQDALDQHFPLESS